MAKMKLIIPVMNSCQCPELNIIHRLVSYIELVQKNEARAILDSCLEKFVAALV